MTRRSYTVSSFFCGIGGLDLGFELEGFAIEWASDIAENAVTSYRLNFGREALCGDLCEMSLSDIPKTDVMIGGPPCQSFSLVGKRSADDPRGRLVFRYVDLIRARRPQVFVLENVAGIAASRIGGQRLPDVLCSALSEEGYGVSLLKLDATDYLVPQRRKRLFLVGSLGRAIASPDPELFARESCGVSRASFDISARAAIDDLGPCVPKGQRAPYRSGSYSDFARLMRSGSSGTVSLHECPRMSETDRRFVQHIPPGGNYRDIPDALSTTRIAKFKASGGRTTTYGRLHPEEPSYTINTYFRRPNVGCNFHYREERLITPREAMRFQALPDRFEICYSSQDERNAYIGNAVPSLLARAIAWTVRRALEGVRESIDRRQVLFHA